MSRASIGCNYTKQPYWKILLGVPFIYIPILTTVPFVIIGTVMIKIHLKHVGGMNLKSYWEFVPSWVSHRYTQADQPTPAGPWWRLLLVKYKWFWLFNCKLYCPLSVALFRYATYLVMIVENWWCPFAHERKDEYGEAAIDKSFWHVDPQDRALLHSDDERNPIWNAAADVPAHTESASGDNARAQET